MPVLEAIIFVLLIVIRHFWDKPELKLPLTVVGVNLRLSQQPSIFNTEAQGRRNKCINISCRKSKNQKLTMPSRSQSQKNSIRIIHFQ